LLFLEPLDFLFNLLWVNLCLTVLLILVLVPRCCKEPALLEKGLEARPSASDWSSPPLLQSTGPTVPGMAQGQTWTFPRWPQCHAPNMFGTVDMEKVS